MVKAGVVAQDVPGTIALEQKRAWARNLPQRARMAALRRACTDFTASVARRVRTALPKRGRAGFCAMYVHDAPQHRCLVSLVAIM